MDREHLWLIALGGIAGATVRWGISETAIDGALPWATLLVNVAGSLLLGMVSQLPPHRMNLQIALGTGFCGGLTTFSTFAVEVALLARADDYATGSIYLVASVVLAGGGFLIGRRLPHPRVLQ